MITTILYIPAEKIRLAGNEDLSTEQNAALWNGVKKKREMMLIMREKDKDIARITYQPADEDPFHSTWQTEIQNCQDPKWGDEGYLVSTSGWMNILTPYEACKTYIKKGWKTA